jgi:mRNA interferase MazF
LSAAATSLPKDSVANVSLIVALDKRQLVERVGTIPRRQLELVLPGIDVIVGR